MLLHLFRASPRFVSAVACRCLASGSATSTPKTGIDKERARLLYQSKKRGILENDIILGGFAEDVLPSLNEEQLKAYDRLINGHHMEWDLYYYLSGSKPPPAELETCDVFEMVRRYSWERAQKRPSSLASPPGTGGR